MEKLVTYSIYIFISSYSLNANLINTTFSYSELGEHTIVSDSNVFPYVVAILKKSSYLSAGALIDENWVLTAADSLFLLRESARLIRIRLGSINCKKGGTVYPIKFFEIHPNFRDTKPEFDVALVKLPHPVRLTPSLNPIKLQKSSREITATHFTVTSWPAPAGQDSDEESQQQLKSMELIKRRRILTVSHLHPTDEQKCAQELEGLDVNDTDTMMCLDLALENEPCQRDVGAPVVLNGILWGIVSSWKSEDCEIERSPSFVTLVAAHQVNTWIHATVTGHRWRKTDRVISDGDDNYI